MRTDLLGRKGKDMTSRVPTMDVVLLSAWMLLVILALVPQPGLASETRAEDLLTIGKPLDTAVGAKLWTDKTPGDTFRSGERLIVSLEADRDAYLTVLSVSPQGSVSVVFPNQDVPDGRVAKGQPNTLFGDDSSVRLSLGRKAEKGGLVFYLTLRPLTVGTVAAGTKKSYVTLGPDAQKQMQVIKEQLEVAAKDASFNRLNPSFRDASGAELQIKARESERLMGVKPYQKKLPPPVEGTPPEPLTGVQGIKTDPKDVEGR
jgi:hypothetical protein